MGLPLCSLGVVLWAPAKDVQDEMCGGKGKRLPELLLNATRREGSGALCPLPLSFPLEHGCDIANAHNHLDHEMTTRLRHILHCLEWRNSGTEGGGVLGDCGAAASTVGCLHQTSLVREGSFTSLEPPLLGGLEGAKLILTHATLHTRSLHAARCALRNRLLHFCSLCLKRQSRPPRLPIQFRV